MEYSEIWGICRTVFGISDVSEKSLTLKEGESESESKHLAINAKLIVEFWS